MLARTYVLCLLCSARPRSLTFLSRQGCLLASPIELTWLIGLVPRSLKRGVVIPDISLFSVSLSRTRLSSVFLWRALVVIHGNNQFLFLCVENVHSVDLENIPHVCVVHFEVSADLADGLEQLLNAAVDVAFTRVSARAHNVLQLFLIFIDLEVPDLIVGSVRGHEFALLVFKSTFLNWVDNLDFMSLFVLFVSSTLFCYLKRPHVIALTALE